MRVWETGNRTKLVDNRGPKAGVSVLTPLQLTTTNMASEAYIALALYDGIARGLPRTDIWFNVAEAYRVYQSLENRPMSLFVNEWSDIENRMALLPDCPGTLPTR